MPNGAYWSVTDIGKNTAYSTNIRRRTFYRCVATHNDVSLINTFKYIRNMRVSKYFNRLLFPEKFIHLLVLLSNSDIGTFCFILYSVYQFVLHIDLSAEI